MAAETGSFCREGLQYLFEAGMSEQQVVPANFYVGLVEDESVDFDNSLGDLTELAGNGYSPQAVASNSTDLVSATTEPNGWKLTTKEVTFTASGGAWETAKNAILKTTSDDSGKLLGYMELDGGAGYTLADGEHVDVTMVLALFKKA